MKEQPCFREFHAWSSTGHFIAVVVLMLVSLCMEGFMNALAENDGGV